MTILAIIDPGEVAWQYCSPSGDRSPLNARVAIMGMGTAFLEYLVEKRLLRPNYSVLDIGSQNLYNATPDTIRDLINRLGPAADEASIEDRAKRLTYFSTPRPGERTAFVAELFELTSVSYLGYDVCP